MKNLKAVLTAANATLDQVVKTTIFMTDLTSFAAVNAIYSEFFNEATAPARSTVQVAALPRGASIEIDAIAMLG